MGRARTNGMTAAAIVMSALTVLFGSSLLTACLCGGLGMTFAMLSRDDGRLSIGARVALIISVLGVVASVIITVYMVKSLIESGALEYYMHILEDELRGYY